MDKKDIHRTFITVEKMLRDRGVVAEEIFKSMETVDVAKTIFWMGSASTGHLLIYDVSPKFRVNNIKKLLEMEGFHTIIIVLREIPASNIIRAMLESQKTMTIQFFELRELLYNVTEHDLVPKHEIIPESEVQSILDTYQLKHKTQLPLIFSSDPVARYLGAQPGQVLRITRVSFSCGQNYAYRCCVK